MRTYAYNPAKARSRPPPLEITEEERKLFASAPGLSSGRKTCRCEGHLVAMGHKSSPGVTAHRWLFPVNQCDKTRCMNPICVARHSRKRADRVRKQLVHLREHVQEHVSKRAGKLRLLCFVMTIPDEVLPEDRKKLHEVRRACRQVLSDWVMATSRLHPGSRKDRAWKVGGVDVYHPTGDPSYACRECGKVTSKKARTCKDCGSALLEVQSARWRPHIHVEIPAYAWHEGTGEWTGLRCQVEKEELDLLRELWGSHLARVLGWNPEHGDLSRCSVHFRWVSHWWKMDHRVRYDFRHFPGYHGQWRSIRWWGYLAPRWRSRIGIELPPEEEDDSAEETGPHICPACGRESDVEHFIYVGDDPEAPLEWARAPPWMQRATTVLHE